jgi:hypothetical protein
MAAPKRELDESREIGSGEEGSESESGDESSESGSESESGGSSGSGSDDDGSDALSGSSSALELEIDLDREGRPEGVTGTVDFSFRSHQLLRLDAVQLAAARRACARAFTARAAKRRGYSSGATYWLSAATMREPNARLLPLEKLARYIFELHAGDASFDPARSGAEWWSQHIDARDAIGWHWDRDYALEAEHGLAIHPAVATVTYLSDVGAPTLVLENAHPVLAADEPPPSARALHVSWPRTGKHIAFDGRWLHGAPEGFPAAALPTARVAPPPTRTTFLVNVWLNHKPVASERAPAALGGRKRSLRLLHSSVRAALPLPLRLHRAAKLQRVPWPVPLRPAFEPRAAVLGRGRLRVAAFGGDGDADAVGDAHGSTHKDSRLGHARTTREAAAAAVVEACEWRVYTDKKSAAAPLVVRALLPLHRLRTLAREETANGGASCATVLLGDELVTIGRAGAPGEQARYH